MRSNRIPFWMSWIVWWRWFNTVWKRVYFLIIHVSLVSLVFLACGKSTQRQDISWTWNLLRNHCFHSQQSSTLFNLLICISITLNNAVDHQPTCPVFCKYWSTCHVLSDLLFNWFVLIIWKTLCNPFEERKCNIFGIYVLTSD